MIFTNPFHSKVHIVPGSLLCDLQLDFVQQKTNPDCMPVRQGINRNPLCKKQVLFHFFVI